MRSTTTPIMCLCVSLSLHLVHKYDWSNGPSQFVCIVKIVSVAASQSVTFRHKCAFPSLSALPDPTQYNYNIRQRQRQRHMYVCVCLSPLLVSLHAARSHSIHLPSALSQSCSFTFPPWVLDLVYPHSKHALFSQRLLFISVSFGLLQSSPSLAQYVSTAACRIIPNATSSVWQCRPA